MFPDSSFTSLNCGKTKASYIAVHALAPYAREQFRNLYSGKLFGLHVDETTYNRKSRLEFWIVHFADGTRFCRYMTTIELDVSLNIEEFLRNTSSAKTLDDVKLQDANAVFAAIESALALYHLSFDNLVYLALSSSGTLITSFS